jgi:Zn-dependent peptidase ImmA (M78 family)
MRVIYIDFDPKEVATPAIIAPEDEGFVAIVAQSVAKDDPFQARMYVAHEAAHALFWDRSGEGVPLRAAAWPPTHEEEKFCNDFAVELLALEDAEEITPSTEDAYE